jgi:Zn-dependent M28 family amino/carboxypeptidase
VDAESLEAHVRKLTDEMTPRDFDHLENMENTADYVREQFSGTGARISELSYKVKGKTFRIVSGLFGPDTKERIVVGAHYDAVPGSPGADDNASGVAGLLEMAAAFGEKPPPMEVELAAYPNEEPPFFRSRLMGSYVHARHLKEEKVPVRLMIALESIGYFNDRPFTQLYPNPFFRLLYPSRGNFIAVVSRLRDGLAVRRIKKAMRTVPDLSVHSFNGPSFIAGVDYSDHRSYWKAGYRAVMVTDTAFYRNDHYHTPQDLSDTLDYTRLSKVVQGVYAAVLAEAK